MMSRKPISKKLRMQVYEKCRGHCAYCGCALEYKDMQVDHVKPVSLCGENTVSNMLPACRSCNHYKSSLGIEDFRKYVAALHDRMLRDNVNYRTLNRFGIVKREKASIVFYFEEAANEV